MPGRQEALRPQGSWPTTRTRCGPLCVRLLLLLTIIAVVYPFEFLDIDDTSEEEVNSINLNAVETGLDDPDMHLLEVGSSGPPHTDIPVARPRVEVKSAQVWHSRPKNLPLLLLTRSARGHTARADSPTVDPLSRLC